MTTATVLRAGSVIIAAPIEGRVRLYPPRELCGELEVYKAHETIATVTNDVRSERVAAPAHGFLLRALVADGAAVVPESPLAVFSVTG